MTEFIFGIGEGLKGESPEILAKGFGIRVLKTAAFIPPKGISSDRKRQFDEIEVIEPLFDGTSYLGTPVLDEVIIAGGQFFELSDTSKTNPIPYDGLTLQTVLLEVTQSKNIVTTALQGRDGTVKEFVSDGDFVITMTGILVGENDSEGNIQNIGNIYPDIDTKKLIEICKVPDSITLTSNFLQLFGINETVITAYTINQPQAIQNIQPFQISLLSDVPIELNELASQ